MAKRSPEEKKEIYNKWKSLINMSQKSLDSWAKNDDRLLASINREEAEEAGDIQSGYDSFHRIKRRKSKPFDKWTAQDFDNAAQENGFNSRMLGGKPGQPIKGSGMSKWEISLRNWGHDPSLKSSPAHSKWKSWKMKHSKKASMNNLILAHLMSDNRRLASDKEKVVLDATATVINDISEKASKKIDKGMVAKVKYLIGAVLNKKIHLGSLWPMFVEYTPKTVKKMAEHNPFAQMVLDEFDPQRNPAIWADNVVTLVKAKTLGEVAMAANIPFERLEKFFGFDPNYKEYLSLLDEYINLKEGWFLTTSFEDMKDIKSTISQKYREVVAENNSKFESVAMQIRELEEKIELADNRADEALLKGELFELRRKYDEYKSVQKGKFSLHEIPNFKEPSSKAQIVLMYSIRKYSEIMKYLSLLPDTKILAVKSIFVGLKIAAFKLIWPYLKSFLFTGKALSAKTVLMGAATSAGGFIVFVAIFALLTNAKFTASHLRKMGVVLGSTTLSILLSSASFITALVGVLFAIASEPFILLGWLVKYLFSQGIKTVGIVADFIKNKFKGNKKAALQRIASRVKRDPSYRRRLKANLEMLSSME
jgi:hypothetical protein